MKPEHRPSDPRFSSGPCTKHPGWSPRVLESALVGRSHRAAAPLEKIRKVLDETRRLLGLPDGYRVALVPASDTGAFEMALWSVLGARGVDVLSWESFGKGWAVDVVRELGIENARVLNAPYGELPDLGAVDFEHDVVFTWNGTTSGVCVPDGNWIPEDRSGLTICDATSAAFSMLVPWKLLDVATFSWQKALGGEAQHGILVLSPRAVERLETYKPPRPLPKIFRMTKAGKIDEALFRGATINTPSMLCVEDALDALAWVESIGGEAGAREKSRRNLAATERWVEKTEWIDFLPSRPEIRSCTSMCFQIVDPWFSTLDERNQRKVVSSMAGCLDKENAALDIAAHRDAPPGIRIWGGATVDEGNLKLLFPWLDWAFANEQGKADK